MIELHGKYGKAKIYTGIVDESSISQVVSLLKQPYIEITSSLAMENNK